MLKTFPLLIAEIANTHGGNINYLKEIIRKTQQTKVDAIKFQIIRASEILTSNHPQYKLFKSLEFSKKEWIDNTKYIKNYNKKIVTDIFGENSLEIAKAINPDYIKIHSTDFNNYDLIKKTLKMSKPILLNIGGATISEINEVVKLLKNHVFCLQLGFQDYPTPINEINLNKILRFKAKYDCPIGFADHSKGDSNISQLLPCIAVAKGADSIEKHIKLKDRKTKYDWESAIPVEKINALKDNLLNTISSLGKTSFELSNKEKTYREKTRRQLVILKAYKKGDRIKKEDISFLRGKIENKEIPLTYEKLNQYKNSKLKRDIKRYSVLTEEMFK